MKKFIVSITLVISSVLMSGCDSFEKFEELDKSGEKIGCTELINHTESLSIFEQNISFAYYMIKRSKHKFSQCQEEIETELAKSCKRYIDPIGDGLTVKRLRSHENVFEHCPDFVKENLIDDIGYEIKIYGSGLRVVKITGGGSSKAINPMAIVSSSVSSELIAGISVFEIKIKTNASDYGYLTFYTTSEEAATEINEEIALSISSIGQKTGRLGSNSY